MFNINKGEMCRVKEPRWRGLRARGGEGGWVGAGTWQTVGHSIAGLYSRRTYFKYGDL